MRATGKRVENTKIQVLRYLQDMQYVPGDKLPSHEELRKQLDCGGSTLSSVLRVLQDEGVLELRDKVGTFVKSSVTQSVTFGRTIGILRLPVAGSSFKAFLEHYLQLELTRNGCSTIFFGEEDADQTAVEKSAYFMNCVNSRALDAVIDISHQPEVFRQIVAQYQIPMVLAAGEDAECHGVMPNFTDILTKSIPMLKKVGCSRLALVMPRGGHDEFNRNFFQIWSDLVAPVTFEEHENQIFYYENIMGGRDLARDLMKLPCDRRPEGIIFMDDGTSLGFTCTMCKEFAQEGCPQFITTSLKQRVFYWPVAPVLRFEFDIECYAKMVVAYLMEYLQTGNPPANRNYELSIMVE